NIVMNARQSMPAGGQIDIRLTNSDLLKENLLAISKSNYIKITITDKGSGIRKKNLEKIFDPYFTTRKNGSGMGLSICYSIIKKHGGYLSVSSQVGTGTTLTIYLPAISTQTLKDKTLKTI
ncbi:MAG TPA: hybrid sensor histidine kinase/response regulator, partial [Desulfobacterales bacterium]|nr:hybrid sensor histidine kinase/response regulator [Desulfobacterales bacterium]